MQSVTEFGPGEAEDPLNTNHLVEKAGSERKGRRK